VAAGLPENTQCSVNQWFRNRAKVSGKSANLKPALTGTPLALIPVVRLTTPRDEHTTIAIQRTDAADACASVTVPPTGVDLVAVERALIQFALDSHGGNRTHAAQFLGLSRSALLYRMQKHNLVRPQGLGPDPAAQS
jgi:DNA-binding NtrC family response regulator